MTIRSRPRPSTVAEGIVTVECSRGEPLVNELEEKLVRLALDPAARGGEVDVSAVKLVHSWRRRGVRPESIISATASAGTSTAVTQARTRRMPFGRYRGKALAEIPCDYLYWCLEQCSNLNPNLRAAIKLVLLSAA